MPPRKTGKQNRKKRARKTVSKSPSSKPKLLIGKVYANWCGHCINLKPKWEQMEREIRQMPQMNHVVFISIEESEKDKMNKFKMNPKYASLSVSGYPTIFSHNGREFNYYHGQPDTAALKQWVMRGGK
jgi:thiol-disulfide isomerase/thioredoxin